MGHLPKTIKQQQITEAFEDYGQVKSVDVSTRQQSMHCRHMYPLASWLEECSYRPAVCIAVSLFLSPQVVAPRGCAYVVMVHRSDAARALGGLKELRLAGNLSKVC